MNVNFILHYHLSFRKEFFFSNVSISVNTILECSYLLFGYETGHLLSTYATAGIEGSYPKCLQVRKGGKGYRASYVRALMFLLYGALFYL